MKLKEILDYVKDNQLKIGLCYVGDKDYAITTKKALLEDTTLLDNRVKSINAFKIKELRVLKIKIFKNFE